MSTSGTPLPPHSSGVDSDQHHHFDVPIPQAPRVPSSDTSSQSSNLTAADDEQRPRRWMYLGFGFLVVAVITFVCFAIFSRNERGEPPAAKNAGKPSVVVDATKSVRCGRMVADDCANVAITTAMKWTEFTGSPHLNCGEKAITKDDSNGVLIAVNVCGCKCEQ